MALRLVNWSERKQPPTRSTIMMIQCGVPGVNSPLAAMKAAAMKAFAVSTARKPKVRRMRAANARPKRRDAEEVEPHERVRRPPRVADIGDDRDGSDDGAGDGELDRQE